jgi:hypothetical protein
VGERVGGDTRGAEFYRAQIEKRYAPRKVDAQVERFELNPGKSDIVRFLNEHSGE